MRQRPASGAEPQRACLPRQIPLSSRIEGASSVDPPHPWHTNIYTRLVLVMAKTRPPRDFRNRTPLLLRCLVMVAYFEIARRGVAMLMFATPTFPSEKWFHDARRVLVLYTFTYAAEMLWAIYPGWISMEGVDMKHMYEHHLPGVLVGACLCWHLFGTVATEETSLETSFLSISHVAFCVGLVTQFCEFFFVARTFLPKPKAWWCKITQRLLGFTLVSALSLSVQRSFLAYAKSRYDGSLGEFRYAELVIVPTSLYLAFYLHPQYIRTHFKRLKGLIFGNARKRRLSSERLKLL